MEGKLSGSQASGFNEFLGVGSSVRALFPTPPDGDEPIADGGPQETTPEPPKPWRPYPKALELALSVAFGVGAWLTVNGVFVELPILVQAAPEGWALPSHLSLAVQVANSGPILYVILLRFSKRSRAVTSRTAVVYVILLMGAAASLALAFTWDKPVGGRSWPTLILTFVFALVGCTSSVLFIPFMASFRPRALAAYFTGEGIGGLLPGIIALAQGAGGDPQCAPDGTPLPPLPPNFSPKVYFLCLFALMMCSVFGFLLLERRGRGAHQMGLPREKMEEDDFRSEVRSYNEGPPNEEDIPSLSTTQLALLLAIAFWACLLANGALPGIQTYSCAPYGTSAYHLSATLSAMANPATCLVVFFTPIRKSFSLTHSFAMIFTILGLAAVAATVLSGLALTTALLSPKPPLIGYKSGEVLIVLIWIGLTIGAVYTKVGVAGALQEVDSRAKTTGRGPLLWYGAITQAGSAVGSIISFLAVTEFQLFVSPPPC
ncbi:solute carrier family 52, riboflavin transporter, member 3-B-like isoform X2 [Ischnura elegans]|uniref:solute carrier family 52, riboflavin transporter, member 3-B-like isoform X2 n=1 Tax=Ischnura elegans TaxID=197161 RepID=UPI001ED89D5A|nr:solute carrier family 52, riboflavin transporter, member 3-B-like isoform X2 [Ischnura elegans]